MNDENTLNHDEVQAIADRHGLGTVEFEERIALNTHRPMEVGYVWQNRERLLFCKRSQNRLFKLCNEFAKLS